MPDHYQALGVQRNATADQIKQAYRQLAMKYHPDRNPGDRESEAQFKELTTAYKTLSDDMSRATYDRSLRASVLVNIQQWATKTQANDLTTSLTITLEEAISGCRKTVRVEFKKVEVAVPPGIITGTNVRVVEGGLSVVVVVTVTPHAVYVLEGRDVIMTATAPYPLFVVGGTATVETPRGPRRIKVKPLSRSGIRKSFIGEGCSASGDAGTGDLIVTLEIEVRQHSSEQLKRLGEYAKALQLPVPKKRWHRF